jgi:transposase-like protein
VVKNGKDKNNKQRFLCRNEECNQQTFLINYSRIGRQPWGLQFKLFPS